MSDDQRWERWRKQISWIWDYVRERVIDHHLFTSSMGMLSGTERARGGAIGFNWIQWTYGRGAVIAGRSMMGGAAGNRRTVSLRILLDELCEDHDVVTLERFSRSYLRIVAPEGAESSFAPVAREKLRTLIGEDAEVLPRRLVEDHRLELTEAWEKFKRIADKRIAHFEPKAKVKDSTLWSDLDRFLALLGDVTDFYHRLLMQSDGSLPLLPFEYEHGHYDEQLRRFWAD